MFGVLNASYTDNGASGAPALTGEDEIMLQPKLKQAEFFTENNGTQVVTADGASGGKRVGYIDDGDWIKFDPINLTGVDAIGYRVSSGGAGGTITVHKNALDGPVVQTVQVANTGGWDTYVDIAAGAGHRPGWHRPAVPGVQGTGPAAVRRGQHPGRGAGSRRRRRRSAGVHADRSRRRATAACSTARRRAWSSWQHVGSGQLRRSRTTARSCPPAAWACSPSTRSSTPTA